MNKKKQTVKWWKYSGILLIATGILHSVVGIIAMSNDLWAILKDGLLNAVGADVDRNLALWFLVCGIFIIILGQVLHHYIKKEQKPAPKFLGYWLLGVPIIGCIIAPVTGFWLFIPQALIILFAKPSDSKKQHE